MKRPVLTLLVISIINCGAWCQTISPQVVNVCGGNYTQGYYSIDWSVGELALIDQMQSLDGSNIITHGLIQPHTNHPGTITYTTTITDEELKILPNPTRNILEIDYLSFTRGPVTFTLYDAAGRAFYKKQRTSYGFGFIERINMTPFAAGTYMLYVTANSSDAGAFKRQRAYKIIKL
jgi:hypothetical protein